MSPKQNRVTKIRESAVLGSFCQSRFSPKQSPDNILNLNRYFQILRCKVESKHCVFNVFELVGTLLDFIYIGTDRSWRRTSWLVFFGGKKRDLI